MTVYKSVVTKKGLETLMTTREFRFTNIELGTTAWNPTNEAEEIKGKLSPREIYAVVDARRVKNKPALHLTSVCDKVVSETYIIREIGIYIADQDNNDVLFAILSEEGKDLSSKAQNDTILVSFNIDVTGIDIENYSVSVGTRLDLNAEDYFVEYAKDVTKIADELKDMETRLRALEDAHA